MSDYIYLKLYDPKISIDEMNTIKSFKILGKEPSSKYEVK